MEGARRRVEGDILPQSFKMLEVFKLCGANTEGDVTRGKEGANVQRSAEGREGKSYVCVAALNCRWR